MPPRRDWSETRIVETERAGDHFSLRMSIKLKREKVTKVRTILKGFPGKRLSRIEC